MKSATKQIRRLNRDDLRQKFEDFLRVAQEEEIQLLADVFTYREAAQIREELPLASAFADRITGRDYVAVPRAMFHRLEERAG